MPRIASAPAWNEVDIYNGAHWLNQQPASALHIEQYRQTLDTFNGSLRTSYVWIDEGRRMAIQAEQFVSRSRAQLAAVRVTISPEFAGLVSVRFPLRNWLPPHRYALERIQKLEGEAATNQWAIWYPGRLEVTTRDLRRSSHGALMYLSATTPGNGPSVGEAIALDWAPPTRAEIQKDVGGADVQLHLNVKRGESYTFAKFAALATSSAATDPGRFSRQIAIAARQAGWTAVFSASEAAWHALWDSDIVVEGNPKLQRLIHSMLFYLLASARAGLDVSIPPMGLSSAGYYGHIFWDADVYMFPALVILHPELARPIVAFRSRTLHAARLNAARNGYRGAMFPWEAGPDGSETTPRFAFQNASSENHVNGDIALAAWQYWLATGDRNYLEHEAWPLVRDTADFWASRVNFNAGRGRYEISNVVAVRESDIGVSNDAYTNAVAKKNLELATAAARELKIEPNPEWNEISGKMFIPQSDSPLLWYPLDQSYSRKQTLRAVQTFLPEIERGSTGAMMGDEFYPILAAQIGERALLGRLLEPLSIPYLRPPFQVIAETPENQNTNFITGAGAFLQQFIFGYTGLRLGQTGLERRFDPVLPPGVPRLILKNISIHGKRETLIFDSTASQQRSTARAEGSHSGLADRLK